MNIVIEKGVPIPEDTSSSPVRRTFNALEVGDSFFIPKIEEAAIRYVRNFKCVLNKRGPKKFIHLLSGDGLRIWRTA